MRKFAVLLLTIVVALAVGGRSLFAPDRTPETSAEHRKKLRRFARENTGNPARGERLARQLRCVKCHDLFGDREKVGPPLRDVGSRLNREELMEQVLYPSRRNKKRTISVEFANGRIEEYRLLSDERDTLRVQEEGTNKIVTIRKEDVASYAPVPSGMPEGLADRLSAREFTDLIEFLVNRKAKERARRKSGGEKNK